MEDTKLIYKKKKKKRVTVMFLKWRANLALTIGENPHLRSALTFIFNYSTSRAATRTLLAAPTGLELLKQTG